MPQTAISIVSEDADFAEPLAEQLRALLGLSCDIVSDFSKAEGVVVSALEPPAGFGLPFVRADKKPLRLVELMAEVAQAAQQTPEALEVAPAMMLDVRARQLAFGGQEIGLTDKETALLQCLVEAGKAGCSREALHKQVWGYESALDTHTLETHIYRLRNKLRELGGSEQFIAASDGGYVWKP